MKKIITVVLLSMLFFGCSDSEQTSEMVTVPAAEIGEQVPADDASIAEESMDEEESDESQAQ